MSPMPSLSVENPLCPNCLSVFEREVEMEGPVTHPSGAAQGHFYSCPGCNYTARTTEMERRQIGSR